MYSQSTAYCPTYHVDQYYAHFPDADERDNRRALRPHPDAPAPRCSVAPPPPGSAAPPGAGDPARPWRSSACVPGTGGVSSDGTIGPPPSVTTAPLFLPNAPSAAQAAPTLPVVAALPQGHRSIAAALGPADAAFKNPPHDSSLPPWRSRFGPGALDGVAATFGSPGQLPGVVGVRGVGREFGPVLPALRFSGWGQGDDFVQMRKEVPAALPASANEV